MTRTEGSPETMREQIDASEAARILAEMPTTPMTDGSCAYEGVFLTAAERDALVFLIRDLERQLGEAKAALRGELPCRLCGSGRDALGHITGHHDYDPSTEPTKEAEGV